MPERPLGVTIIGILWIIGGLLLLLGGAAIAVGFGALFGALGAVFGAVFVLIGLFQFLLGIGCFKAWGWVWTYGLIVNVLALFAALYAIYSSGWVAIVNFIIPLIILYYLFKPNVKTYFGKA